MNSFQPQHYKVIQYILFKKVKWVKNKMEFGNG
jgi:hypothetical protein